MHVHPPDADGGAPEVEIEAPERSAEGVRQTGRTFIVQGVGLAEDERDAGVGEVGGQVGLRGDGVHG